MVAIVTHVFFVAIKNVYTRVGLANGGACIYTPLSVASINYVGSYHD